jgi:cell division protein FtsA
LEGFCHAASKGLNKGVVTDVTAAADSISNVMSKLKERTGKRITDIYAGVSSSSASVASSEGSVLLSKYSREINERDIARCIKVGSIIKMPLDKEALHYMVSGFSVDGEMPVKNPVNLEGVKLSVKMNILTLSSSSVTNMAKCIALAGFVPEGFVFSGLATSYRVLPQSERQEGAALIDMDTDLTEVLIMQDGILTGCRVFPFGIDKILSKDGNIDSEHLDKLTSRITSLPGWNNVKKTVLTGRASMIDNLIEAIEKSIGRHVDIGTFVVNPLEEHPPERMRYLGNIGILDYLREEKLKRRTSRNLFRRSLNRVLTFVDRYF